MAGIEVSWPLISFVIVNVVLVAIWVRLMLHALAHLDQAPLTEGQRLVWAVVIVTVPIMGGVAFLAAYPPRKKG